LPSAELAAVSLDIDLVVGSFPPDLCGVGDYTSRLAEALADRGHQVHVVVLPAGIGRRRLRASLRQLGGDVVHLQYPSVGSGRSLSPLALLGGLRALRRPTVVTLHEFSAAHPLRRVMAAALATVAQQVVATTQHERLRLRRLPWVPVPHTALIPIGSNILLGSAWANSMGARGPLPGGHACAAGHCRRDSSIEDDLGAPRFDVVYFGLLAPGKGIEAFLELAALSSRRRSGHNFAVIGGWPDAAEHYVASLRRRTAELPVSWTGPLGAKTVSVLLGQAGVAYLPFRDGASERRGSLLAALEHGLPAITTRGDDLSPDLAAAVRLASGATEAMDVVDRLLGSDSSERQRLADAGRAYVAGRSWPHIAARHEQLYRRLVSRTGRPGSPPSPRATHRPASGAVRVSRQDGSCAPWD
jgi:glycosyltransferase involved in cell wall biosynthesis